MTDTGKAGPEEAEVGVPRKDPSKGQSDGKDLKKFWTI